MNAWTSSPWRSSLARTRPLAVSILPLVLVASAHAQWVLPDPVKSVERQPDGVMLTMGAGVLRLEVCSDSIIHVVFAPGATIPKADSYIVTKTEWPKVSWQLDRSEKEITLTTARMNVTIDRAEGSIH